MSVSVCRRLPQRVSLSLSLSLSSHLCTERLKTGDVGGTMGLFIGGSLLTICELLDLVFLNASTNSESDKDESEVFLLFRNYY